MTATTSTTTNDRGVPIFLRTPTRLLVSERGTRIFAKDESIQRSGAYKIRGVENWMRKNASSGPVITASTGNHAAAVSMVARSLGRQCTVCVPLGTPRAKVDRLNAEGAKIFFSDGGYDTCLEEARAMALNLGIDYVPSFDDQDIIDGHQSLFAEAVADIGMPDTVVVPVGGGGGLASALSYFEGTSTRVVGVELDEAAAMRDSLKAGHLVDVTPPSGFAEGLCVRRSGELTFALAQRHVATVIGVSRGEIITACQELWFRGRIRAELAGAAALAGQRQIRAEGKVLILVSGGNIDEAMWQRIILAGGDPL